VLVVSTCTVYIISSVSQPTGTSPYQAYTYLVLCPDPQYTWKEGLVNKFFNTREFWQ